MADYIISAGIDIGTSTSHLTISKLKLQNVASGNRVPKLSVTEREIVYQSSIHSTPLNQDGSINADAVVEIISKEYKSANIQASQIQTGAVIITGESAKLRNAREVATAIATMAGDFVVASAGPQLESLLAGRGAGAALASREQNKVICNIDIGGGTCNYAVFRHGELIDSACLGIGARFIQFDKEGSIRQFTDSGETFLDGVAKLSLLPRGSVPEEELIELVSSLLARIIITAASSSSPPQIVQRLMQTESLRQDYQIDEFWFSGGVAECMREDTSDPFKYGDMGFLLADALRLALDDHKLKYKIAEHGIRATVIGAGMHSLQLSGCTIMVSENTLPIRNARIVHPFTQTDGQLSEKAIMQKLDQSLSELDCLSSNCLAAIAICNISTLSYSGLQTWARALAESHKIHDRNGPLIILSQEDIGLALGQTIKKYAPELELVVLDDVDTSTGDFIDIGKAIDNRLAVPITVKTLVFHS